MGSGLRWPELPATPSRNKVVGPPYLSTLNDVSTFFLPISLPPCFVLLFDIFLLQGRKILKNNCIYCVPQLHGTVDD